MHPLLILRVRPRSQLSRKSGHADASFSAFPRFVPARDVTLARGVIPVFSFSPWFTDFFQKRPHLSHIQTIFMGLRRAVIDRINCADCDSGLDLNISWNPGVKPTCFTVQFCINQDKRHLPGRFIDSSHSSGAVLSMHEVARPQSHKISKSGWAT